MTYLELFYHLVDAFYLFHKYYKFFQLPKKEN
nr:MAG TPA_asm: hypothetical protein [Caudoviricetes sp.]